MAAARTVASGEGSGNIPRIATSDDPNVAARIERGLLAALARRNRQGANRRRTFTARDEAGELVAGLTASTAYGWLHVETLWVEEGWQGHGLGRALMDAAEDFGRAQGCHGAWLDTSSLAAYGFYARLGYRVFGELANGTGRYPPEHRRWFLEHRFPDRENGTVAGT